MDVDSEVTPEEDRDDPGEIMPKKSPARLDQEIDLALRSSPRERWFDCYWEDEPDHHWPVRAPDAIAAARAFAAGYQVPEDPDAPEAVFVVVPEEASGHRPALPKERFRAYMAGGELRVEPMIAPRVPSRRGWTPRQLEARAEKLKAEARTLQALGAAAPRRRTLVLDRRLRGVLGDIDPFWVRWSAFIEGQGGGRVGSSWR